jgi:hypothetical protein
MFGVREEVSGDGQEPTTGLGFQLFGERTLGLEGGEQW